MDKDQIATLTFLAVVLIGVPMGLLALAYKTSQPKDKPLTVREQYPDDHFFI